MKLIIARIIIGIIVSWFVLVILVAVVETIRHWQDWYDRALITLGIIVGIAAIVWAVYTVVNS